MSRRGPWWVGVDVGAAYIKAVVLSSGQVIGRAVRPVGGSFREQVKQVLSLAVEEAGIGREELVALGITGVGADGFSSLAKKFSDVACNARGINVVNPATKTIIDLGGQFTRVIVTQAGKVEDFVVSEKCAAGSGRFLQIIARILQMSIEDVGPLSLTARDPVEFSTGCAVFAESEAISRIAEGSHPADILAGVHRAMAAKVAMLMSRVKWEPPVALVGGGGSDVGLVKAIEDVLKTAIHVPNHPQTVAALGAACLASELSQGASFHPG